MANCGSRRRALHTDLTMRPSSSGCCGVRSRRGALERSVDLPRGLAPSTAPARSHSSGRARTSRRRDRSPRRSPAEIRGSPPWRDNSRPRRGRCSGASLIRDSRDREAADSARKEAAARLLADPALVIAEVAYLLGYSEPAAFHRAFKRWTGETPQAFRVERWPGRAEETGIIGDEKRAASDAFGCDPLVMMPIPPARCGKSARTGVRSPAGFL